jgi:hypothetical protein
VLCSLLLFCFSGAFCANAVCLFIRSRVGGVKDKITRVFDVKIFGTPVALSSTWDQQLNGVTSFFRKDSLMTHAWRARLFPLCVATFKRASLFSSLIPILSYFQTMSKRNFLVVSPKTACDVDVASRVSSYIQTCLSLAPETQSAVKESLDELNRLRRNAFLHDECGKSTSSIENMYK